MFAYLRAKLYISLVIVVSIPLAAFAVYYYFSAMSVNQGALNINKISEQNRVYTYSVFSDFYFRATRYDQNGNRIAVFAEVAPTEVAIGYDFRNDKPLLRDMGSGNRMIMLEENSKEIGLVNTLRAFSSVYAELVATQDQHYFDKAFERIETINQDVFGGQLNLPTTPKTTDSYEELMHLPVANLKAQPFKLNNISPNLRVPPIVAPVDEWHPNLIEYRFGESDRIFLQYLTRFTKTNIEEFFDEARENSTLVRAIGYHNNQPINLTFRISEDTSNQIDAYFMDVNGYVYLLRYIAQHQASFDRYLPDFLKIAFSVNFVDVQGFENWFATEQLEREKHYANYVQRFLAIQQFDNRLTNIRGKNLLAHFGLSPIGYDLVEYRPRVSSKNWWFTSKREQQSLVRFEEAFSDFRQQFGFYPNGSELRQEHELKSFLSLVRSQQIIDNREDTRFFRAQRKYIEEVCSTIECVRNLEANGWEIHKEE